MNWQEEFIQGFVDEFNSTWKYPTDLDDVYTFIQSLLDQQKKELLEKIKLRIIEIENVRYADYEYGYNQAVSDLEEIKQQLSEEAEIP